MDWSLAAGPDVLAAADSYVSWRADQPVKLRLADSGPLSRKPLSIVTAFRRAVQRFPDHPALGMHQVHPLCILAILLPRAASHAVVHELVHGQVTIIFVVSVCLFVCAEFFSAIFDPISIKLGHMLFVWV